MSKPAQLQDRDAQHYVAIPLVTTVADLPRLVPTLWPEVFAWLNAKGIEAAGAPFVRYFVIEMPKRIELEVAVPVANAVDGDGRVVAGMLPGGRYATLLHEGPPDKLIDANAALQHWAEGRGIAWNIGHVDAGEVWGARVETYLTDPDPVKQRVEIAYLVANGHDG